MNDDNEKVGSRRRSARKGQYYEMALDYRPARPRLTWENAAALAPGHASPCAATGTAGISGILRAAALPV
jgi:hypothetical protein